MSLTLHILNPSNYCRKGFVEVPWNDICASWQRLHNSKIQSGQIALCQEPGSIPLPFQIDNKTLSDPILTFQLASHIEPAKSMNCPSIATVILNNNGPPNIQGAGPYLDIVRLQSKVLGVKLINSRLEIWFNLTPRLDKDTQNWFSGAATSVLLDRKEILDPNPLVDWHDLEKRCMQLDKIQLLHPDVGDDQEARICQEVDLINEPYNLECHYIGPVRASIVITRDFPFHYQNVDTGKKQELRCRLFRVITINRESDYVIEELFVEGSPPGTGRSKKPVKLKFIAHYFSYIQSLELKFSKFQSAPNWFVVSDLNLLPHQACGVAAESPPIGPTNPHPVYPKLVDNHGPNFPVSDEMGSFSWELAPCRLAKSLYVFMRREPQTDNPPPGKSAIEHFKEQAYGAKQDFEHRVGRAWHEIFHAPLQAVIQR